MDMRPYKVEHDQMETFHIVFINKSHNITRGHLQKMFVGWLRVSFHTQSAKFTTEDKILNFILQNCQKTNSTT